MAKKNHTPSPARLRREAEIETSANVVFDLSLQRARHRCPAWARTPQFRELFLRVYRHSARQNFIQRYIPKERRDRFHVDHIVPSHVPSLRMYFGLRPWL